MNSIKQDPVQLRHFASVLRSHASYWQESVSLLSGHLGRLGASWRDDQFDLFDKEVRALVRSLSEYNERAQETAAQLEQDATLLEHQQNIRL